MFLDHTSKIATCLSLHADNVARQPRRMSSPDSACRQNDPGADAVTIRDLSALVGVFRICFFLITLANFITIENRAH